MTTDLILGTAGHIDHGKTSLIGALTGIETDRLPEEKRRGITIELGFAYLELGEYRLGIVDVPGHERFVRNMLAGATGVDLALLVVAADDSVKPQTREHLEILRLLDLEAGVIAITKCDLVELDWIDLVAEEIRELVADTFLATAPIVRASSTTGEGLAQLREELAKAARTVADGPRAVRIHGPFRMPVDRAFTIAGHGTVVTGSVNSGRTRVGDEMAIEPGSTKVRIRGLQNHDQQVDEVHRGQRAAINLAGIHHEALQRGHELCSPGHLQPSRLWTARISLLPSAVRPLKNRSRVRVHVGTAELLSMVWLLGQDRVEPGESAAAQLFLSEPAVAVWRQPLVIRTESPVVTVGGGTVLDPSAQRIRQADEETLAWMDKLESADTTERASAALYFAGLNDWRPEDLPRTAGVERIEAAHAALLECGDLLEIATSPTRKYRVHRNVFVRLCNRIEVAMRKLHEKFPLRMEIDRVLLMARFRYLGEDSLLAAAIEEMKTQGRIRVGRKGIALVGHGPKLSQSEKKVMAQLVDTIHAAGLQVPSVQQIQKDTPKNQDSVPQLLALAAANGDLVEIAAGYYLHAEVEQATRGLLKERLTSRPGLTISEIREILNTTRKYAVPLCEHFDRIGFTTRQGDKRVLAS
ncbi:MAG: selenocysteine-specific translation elongation factor [Pirellulaceae bacterium]